MTAKKLYQARRFHIEEVFETLPDGKRLARQVVRHPGAVVILPILDNNSICLIKTYRVAIQKWILELPAGTLDKGLPPIDVAHLELQEETGYRAGKMTPIHDFAMSPGILDEKMHFFVAKDLVAGEAEREEGEQMSNLIVTWSEVDRLIRDKQIIDAKTLVALLWYMRYREN